MLPYMTRVGWYILCGAMALSAQGPQNPQNPPPQQQQIRPNPQPQPGQQGRPDYRALKEYLDLSDTQIRHMEQAREKARHDAEEKEKSLRPQIAEKRMAMEDLLDKPNADATAVGKAMLEIRGLERQIRQAHEAVRTAEVGVLSPEQKAKFKAIQDAANLPQATRDAQRMGLVPGPVNGRDPNQRGPKQPGPNQPGPGMMQPGPGFNGPGPNGPRPPGPRGGQGGDQ
jgi:Spy/CpxP family protein refolding chaperone